MWPFLSIINLSYCLPLKPRTNEFLPHIVELIMYAMQSLPAASNSARYSLANRNLFSWAGSSSSDSESLSNLSGAFFLEAGSLEWVKGFQSKRQMYCIDNL